MLLIVAPPESRAVSPERASTVVIPGSHFDADGGSILGLGYSPDHL
jgi:hypothetical protein